LDFEAQKWIGNGGIPTVFTSIPRCFPRRPLAVPICCPNWKPWSDGKRTQRRELLSDEERSKMVGKCGEISQTSLDIVQVVLYFEVFFIV
jgi:hypothetical protein